MPQAWENSANGVEAASKCRVDGTFCGACRIWKESDSIRIRKYIHIDEKE